MNRHDLAYDAPKEKLWFGKWPPEVKGGSMQAGQKSWLERNGITIFLAAAIIVGVLGAAYFSRSHSSFWMLLGEHLFMAIAVSGTIALFVELTLHQRFARNVFEAAIGYFLPEALRGELGWIYGQHFMCELHDQTVHVSRIEGTSLATIRTEVLREFRNISSATKEIRLSLAVNEWFHDGGRPSSIHSFTVRQEGEKAAESLSTETSFNEKHAAISIAGKTVNVGSNKKVAAYFEYEESMCESDGNYVHFSYPTSNVTVRVIAPDDIYAWVEFSNRDNHPEMTHLGSNIWRLTGVLLPLQGIRVMWCPREKLNRRRELANPPAPQFPPATTGGPKPPPPSPV